jgi:stage III sporulation protein SpoIIIAA
MLNNKDLDKLICILPKPIQLILHIHPQKQTLIEIVMDLGRRPEARFSSHSEHLSANPITWQDLDYSTKRLSEFSEDNRAGIERTLHRISCIRNRQGLIIGLTCRVGRSIYGTINIIRDLIESNKSILILGKPGVGKTTMIREIARVLANERERRVVIIDTSNEIAGDSDIPHIGIGLARRMQVQRMNFQRNVMIEAVENHMPEVIIIDEIGTELEALACQTIAERGVQLIGTAHGNVLGNLIKNPTLSDLVGGIQYVTLSDEEAKRRGTQKSIIERKGLPAFQLAIELNERCIWTIHENITNSIDILLQGREPKLQVRKFNQQKKLEIFSTNLSFQHFIILKINEANINWQKRRIQRENKSFVTNDLNPIFIEQGIPFKKFYEKKNLNVYCYSISKILIMKYFKVKCLNFRITSNFESANLIFGLKKHMKTNKNLRKKALVENIPIFIINKNSTRYIKNFINDPSNFKLITNQLK